MKPERDISIIIPCLNEEKSIGFCLDEVFNIIKAEGLDVEVIVIDNNSFDKTAEIVKKYQEKLKDLVLIKEERVGYGSAYLTGFNNASGKYIFMADGDGSYDFSLLKSFVDKLKSGFDMVIGDRFSSKNIRDTMPWLHRKIGNPLLSFLVRVFFRARVRDVHCGVRAISREALEKITLYTVGMEFASEMIIKVAKKRMKIGEIGIEYRARIGDSKLRSFRDGWRHLRFILLYSPLLLFLLPGIIIFACGLIGMTLFYFGNPSLLGVNFYVHPMFLFSVMIILGYQVIFFSAFSRIYAITHLGDPDPFIEKLFKKITIERTGLLGFLIAMIGVLIYIFIFIKWIASGLGSLNEIKNSIIALTFFVIGVQTFFSAFMLSALGIKEK
ncbi:MAG: glycosyltransferase family 2 protein [Candidatus Paceibacterota bacterium]|jgi:glycosyltransferase involved in cell wall biosynthesis